MEDVRRRCNPMVDLSKFTSNKKILSKVTVRAKNEAVELGLTWAHNLFILWARVSYFGSFSA